ncbi:MAG: hypothetical protein ACRDTF_01395 [Pseudonocardiaceae bacterium]
MDGLQHFHHPLRRAPVEVVDVDDDSVDLGEVVAHLVGTAGFGEQAGHALEVLSDLGHHGAGRARSPTNLSRGVPFAAAAVSQ